MAEGQSKNALRGDPEGVCASWRLKTGLSGRVLDLKNEIVLGVIADIHDELSAHAGESHHAALRAARKMRGTLHERVLGTCVRRVEPNRRSGHDGSRWQVGHESSLVRRAQPVKPAARFFSQGKFRQAAG